MSFAPAAEPCALNDGSVPASLRSIARWVTWRKGHTKENGKFAKVPIAATSGKPVNANDARNWLTFDDAVMAYRRGQCSGIGVALSPDPVLIDGQQRHLVAVDLDHVGGRMPWAEQIWLRLDKPYVEVSPSGDGLRMLALSDTPIKGGNAGNGRELYGSGRFVTVTGRAARGRLKDATNSLQQLEREWFARPATEAGPIASKSLVPAPAAATPETVARIRTQLARISADCTYEKWRNIVWAILSTGSSEAEDIARKWSMSAPDSFDETAFARLVSDFKPDRGLTLGTLTHYAREAGWIPAREAQGSEATLTVAGAKSNASQPRFDLLTVPQLHAMPPMTWRIKGTLPTRGLACIYGPSGSGKSFLAIDLGCAVSSGLPHWFGAAIKAAPVVYVALEGTAGIRQRVAAWEARNGMASRSALRILLGEFTLTQGANAEALARDVLNSVGVGAVVIVDTLNQSAPGADENSSAEMGQVLSNAKRLADGVQGVVILVHHAGKDQSKGMRGHSSLFAAMDTVIEVAQKDGQRMWRISKSKESEGSGARAFDLESFEVGQDEEGDALRSCAVKPLNMPLSTGTRRPPTGKNQVAAIGALRAYAAKTPGPFAKDLAIATAATALACDPKHRQSRATDAVDSLTRGGYLVETQGGLVLA